MLSPYRVGKFSLNLKKVDVSTSIVHVILFSRKLETVYMMYKKVFSPLGHVCISVSLIFAYGGLYRFSPMSFTFLSVT